MKDKFDKIILISLKLAKKVDECLG